MINDQKKWGTHNMGTTKPEEIDGPQDQQAMMK